MTAIAALTLPDGQATPVNHTFNPVKIDQAGVALWADRSGGIALGYPTITFSNRTPVKGSRNYKVVAKVTVPVLAQTSASTASGIQPAPTLSHSLFANIEFVLPEQSSLAQRNDLFAYVKALINGSVITAAVQNFESVY